MSYTVGGTSTVAMKLNHRGEVADLCGLHFSANRESNIRSGRMRKHPTAT